MEHDHNRPEKGDGKCYDNVRTKDTVGTRQDKVRTWPDKLRKRQEKVGTGQDKVRTM